MRYTPICVASANIKADLTLPVLVYDIFSPLLRYDRNRRYEIDQPLHYKGVNDDLLIPRSLHVAR